MLEIDVLEFWSCRGRIDKAAVQFLRLGARGMSTNQANDPCLDMRLDTKLGTVTLYETNMLVLNTFSPLV